MNLRKHAFSIVFWVLLALVGGGFLVLLVLTRGGYVEVKQKLQAAETSYRTLSNANPYPSPENVKILQTNLQTAVDFYVDLQDELCRDQAPPEDLGPAQFNVLLQDTFKALLEAADWQGGSDELISGTLLPEPFYFGFDQYTGALPSAENIPRLVRQLRIIEAVSTLLFEHRVAAVESIEREVFEPGLDNDFSGTGRGGMRMDTMLPMGTTTPVGGVLADEHSDLYTVEHINVVFQAQDEQLWAVLDALGSSSQFVVITDVAMENMAPPDKMMSGLGELGGRGMMPMRGGLAPDLMTGGLRGMDLRGTEMDRGGMRGGMSRMPMGRDPGMLSRNPDIMDTQQPVIVLAREDRILAGRDEYVQVQLGLDVYRFCPNQGGDETEAEGGDLLP